MRALWRSLALAALAMIARPCPAQVLTFAALDGWAADDHQAALAVFLHSCSALDAPDWVPLCKLAVDASLESRS